MSAGAIGGCSGSGWADVRQAAGDTQAAKVNAEDTGNDGVGRSRHGHHGHRSHHHHGGGHGLVQAIRDVLAGLGVGAAGTPAGSDAPAAADGSETPVVTDAAVTPGTATVSETTTAADVPAEGATAPGDASAPSAKDVRHALHAFVHTLFQTLSQGGGGVRAAGGDADGDGDGCVGPACGPRAAYRNPGTDLPALVRQSGTDATGGADTGGGGPDLSALTARFQDLVQALGGDPADPAVTLQSFLQGLLDQLVGPSAPAVDTTAPPAGTLVSTTA